VKFVRKWVVLAAGMAVAACHDSTRPTPAFVGNYTLVVEASSVCELLVERFTWDLVGTSAGTSDAGATKYLLTLPGGDTSVAVTVAYAPSKGGRGNNTQPAANTSVRIAAAPDEAIVKVKFSGQSQGTPLIALDGRGQILDGILTGTLEVTDTTRRPPVDGSCTAADHKWILTPQ